MKKIFFVLILGLLFLTGCGGNNDGAKEKKMKIGVSFPNFNDTFMMTVKDGMVKYVKETGKNIELVIVDAKEDSAVQMGQVENFVLQGLDAIIVVPVNTEAITPMTELAKNKGVPLIYTNRKPNNLEKGVYFVGSDDRKAGQLQGEFLVEKLNKKGNIVILQGILSNEGTLARTKGVQEAIAAYPEMKITKVQAGNWERAKGMTIMENWLSSGDKIDAVASNNDDMAIGAIEAIKSAKRQNEIIVIGVDATPDGIGELKAGNLAATVFQNGYGQGKGSIDKAIALINKQETEQVTMIPFVLITPENVETFRK